MTNFTVTLSTTESLQEWEDVKISFPNLNSPFSPILEMNTFGICSDVTDDATVPKALKKIVLKF